MLLNGHYEPLEFTLPLAKAEHHWERLLDTAKPLDGPAFHESQTSDTAGRRCAAPTTP